MVRRAEGVAEEGKGAPSPARYTRAARRPSVAQHKRPLGGVKADGVYTGCGKGMDRGSKKDRLVVSD